MKDHSLLSDELLLSDDVSKSASPSDEYKGDAMGSLFVSLPFPFIMVVMIMAKTERLKNRTNKPNAAISEKNVKIATGIKQ